MSNKKISELPSADEPLNDEDLVEIVQGGINKKAPKSAFDSGGGTWGDIGGTLSNQTDLQAALNLKLDSLITTRTETATHDLDSIDLASVNAGDQLMILMNLGVAGDLEIPTFANVAFPTGTVIGWCQYGAGQLTIVPLSGVTMRSPNSANKSFAQYSIGFIEKIGTNEWVLSGDITV